MVFGNMEKESNGWIRRTKMTLKNLIVKWLNIDIILFLLFELILKLLIKFFNYSFIKQIVLCIMHIYVYVYSVDFYG